MTTIHHLNCGYLKPAQGITILCHCLLLEDDTGLALIDTGIGLKDIEDPYNRIGKELIEQSGYQFNAADTAYKQVQKLGRKPTEVSHCIISHLDPDHIGGLADFPHAKVHVSKEEYENFWDGSIRHRQTQLAHHPLIQTYEGSEHSWFGLEARRVNIPFASQVYLIPLFGHTLGHCGIAVQQQERWILYAGDAYYLRIELETDDNPVSGVSKANALNDEMRVKSLQELRRLYSEHSDEIEIFAYHDPEEFK